MTRARAQSSALAEILSELGATPVLIPALEIVEPSSYAALDDALSRLCSAQTACTPEIAFHWLLFTSVNAVEAFARRKLRLREGPVLADAGEAPQRCQLISRLAAIGLTTAQALLNAGIAFSLDDVLVPPQAVAESLAVALLPYALQRDSTGTRFLLIRAERARELLPEALRAAGAEVTIAAAYRTLVPEMSVSEFHALFTGSSGVDAITFTSSSSVRNLLALCEAAGVTLPPSARRISIGPITSQTLREMNWPPHAEAPEASVRSLAETAMRCLRTEGSDSPHDGFADKNADFLRE